MKRVVILGNGVAGFSAAAKIRELDKSCEIILMTMEKDYFYNRMMLSKALGSEQLLQDIYKAENLYKEESWYEKENIKNMLCCKGKCIDPEKRTVTFCRLPKETQEEISYDALIYALGARAFIPDIDGVRQKNVFALRTIKDAEKIQEALKKADSVAIIGGGIMGLEIAWQCRKKGKAVCVVEAGKHLMEKQLDPEGSAFLMNLLKQQNIRVYCEKTVMEFPFDENRNQVAGVVLADAPVAQEEHKIAGNGEETAKQETISADMVILACGIRPNITVAKESGLDVAKGVLADEHMKTNHKGIFACGDCVELSDHKPLHGLWPEAANMGQIAGENVVSYLNGKEEKAKYESGRVAFYYRGLDTVIFSIGEIGVRSGKMKDWAVKKNTVHQEYQDASAGIYEKYFYHGKDLIGAVLIGAPEKITAVNERIGVKKEAPDGK